MRIALFGGSFDPPHLAHQMVCLWVLSTQEIDEVWMVPCFQHPFDKRSAPFAHRAAMCELAAAVLARVRVCTIEAALGAPSYTLATVKALQARHPEHTFSLIVGADLVKERERWFGWEELKMRVPFMIVGRMGAEATMEGEEAPIKLPAVSSTLARAALAHGRPPVGLVPRAVLEYIAREGLYRGGGS